MPPPHNPVIGAFYQCLCAADKPKKVALVACRHKLDGPVRGVYT
jgi:hypothetical protein